MHTSFARFTRRTVCIGLFGLAALPLASLTAVHAEEKTVALTAIVDHPALDSVREGVRDALKAGGFEEGKNLKFVYQNAQGNPSTAAQIARKFVGDNPNVIVPISTPSAQAVLAATKSIPVVFSAVTDPVAAKLVGSWEASKTNVTGVSDLSPIDRHLDLIRQIVPNAKRLGVIYNPGEANSVALVDVLKKEVKGKGFTLVESPATRSVDVAGAAQNLVGKVDAIYVPTDNNAMSGLEAIVKVAQQSKIPLIAADTDSVKRGAVAALGLNYRDVGYQTGQVVARILNGENPGNIPTQISNKFELHVNRDAAQKQGVKLSKELEKRVSVWVN